MNVQSRLQFTQAPPMIGRLKSSSKDAVFLFRSEKG